MKYIFHDPTLSKTRVIATSLSIKNLGATNSISCTRSYSVLDSNNQTCSNKVTTSSNHIPMVRIELLLFYFLYLIFRLNNNGVFYSRIMEDQLKCNRGKHELSSISRCFQRLNESTDLPRE